MCGRYYVDEDTAKEIERLADEADAVLRRKERKDVHPSEQAVVIRGFSPDQGKGLCAEAMKWGYLSERDGRLLINARAETARERPMFAEDVRYRRIVIPAAGFYEWDRDKNKAVFTDRQGSPLFLAGFYRKERKEKQFMILTAAANESMAPVHDRMPLLLERDEIRRWIYEDGQTEQFLSRKQKLLRCQREYEQLCLPF